jgi:hypothetical protein
MTIKAYLLVDGFGVMKNIPKERDCLQSRRTGSVAAMNNLGWMHQNDTGPGRAFAAVSW